MKIFCGIGVVLFGLFAYWQINDLGQYGTEWWQGWLLTYAVTSLVCLVSLIKLLPKWAYWLGAIMAFTHAALRSLAIQFDETVLFNENNPAGNETGGLIIVCAWLIALAVWKRPKEA